MNTLRLEFGALLRRERQSRKLTLTKLGKLAGLSYRYVGAIERGDANVSMAALERLAHALGWNPFQKPPATQDAGATADVRARIRAALKHISDLSQTAIPMIDSLENATTTQRLVDVGQQLATPPFLQRRPETIAHGSHGLRRGLLD